MRIYRIPERAPVCKSGREMKYYHAFAIQERTYETYGYTVYLARPVCESGREMEY